MHGALVERPGSIIRRLGGKRSGEMRFRRFLHNSRVTVAEMSGHAGVLTGRRAAGRDVIAIQDTTDLVLAPRRPGSRYGSVGKGNVSGLLLHPVLAVEAGTGALLGMVSMQIWNRPEGDLTPRRERATADKESRRWIEGAAQAGTVLAQAASITMVSDRESDFYEYFVQRPHNVDLILRACQNRRVEAEAHLLFRLIDGQAEQGRIAVTIPAAPGRRKRDADLAIRFSPVTLRRPRHGADPMLPETINLTLVDVREVAAPQDGSEPVHWRLLTTHTVNALIDAHRIVDVYRMRWAIEEYFRTLKTAGFDIEDAEIGDPHAMMNFTAAAAIAAVTIRQLVHARGGDTDQVLGDAFDPDDQPLFEAVCASLEGKTARQKNPHPNASLAFAAWVIARLGGWDAYYGKPGPKIMRIGLERFHAIKFGASLRSKLV